MDKEKHINYWFDTAKDDLATVNYLLEGKKYVQALFFTHLCIEKILKANWVKTNTSNIPPKTHNLLLLLEQAKINLSEDDTDFLQKLTAYQIEGRYPDYLSLLHKTVIKNDAETIIKQAKILFECLQEKLQ